MCMSVFGERDRERDRKRMSTERENNAQNINLRCSFALLHVTFFMSNLLNYSSPGAG